jgi:glycerophosphoryl diester phosphodiesterase
MFKYALTACWALGLSLSLGVKAEPIQALEKPLVIGHRGASGILPEHTLPAYEAALNQGADYFEPDLVSTKDGVLVARHENEIGTTTDAAQKFPDRKRTRIVDGQSLTGWFVEDFTLAEIKQLRAVQRLAFRDQQYNGQFSIPTLAEILTFRARQSERLGRPVGIYIETKHPTYFRSIGLPIEEKLLKHLAQHDLMDADDPVFIQSFEVGNLQWLNRRTEVPLIQLIESSGAPADQQNTGLNYASMLTPQGLAQVALYADGIGPDKRLIVPLKDGALQAPTALITQAHQVGLRVHPWTFRSDASYLAEAYRGDPTAEYLQFMALGVDGVFSDFSADAYAARTQFLAR